MKGAKSVAMAVRLSGFRHFIPQTPQVFEMPGAKIGTPVAAQFSTGRGVLATNDWRHRDNLLGLIL